ncbi:hypothetical protein [Paraburkholderia acidiphila]|uniref:Uncharacterized protein n=1 Tax=Paraburkholderia acidiphila TaxID=2571747 RepID=A0A7Z2J7R7_9BURK|nr:hypothetical protein [Paraburkholderia acidiphila]QGZ53529.1 hypothetical protein FAZ97_00645 [Paraburkholderia acidiphila]
MSTFQLGLKAVRRLCEDKNPLLWHKAKLSDVLFNGDYEMEVFGWVNHHVNSYKKLPAIETLISKFPELKDVPTPEPSKYYLDLLDNRFVYGQIDSANIESQGILAKDPKAVDAALARMRLCLDATTRQKLRMQIMDLGNEAPLMVLNEYHKINAKETLIDFGWPSLDTMVNTLMPGDVVSFVGRPASGKRLRTHTPDFSKKVLGKLMSRYHKVNA